ncbi:P-loop containing nucleoside triphosphate hydrolase [Fusarium albosuccineum]|uniref:P-loop containing nucleoside triphosphate hydrolase n=1 Tax=Fusarium albosuccineum TaxID=1237068 RepID=A0A8H4KWA3_9HYPO|nr:P-loop containing nucleoside triphosphate hydrolase [Fusarium albosuccineum]
MLPVVAQPNLSDISPASQLPIFTLRQSLFGAYPFLKPNIAKFVDIDVSQGPSKPDPPRPRFLVIHQVKCPGSSPAHSRHPAIASFLDVPRLFQGDSKASALRGRLPDDQSRLHAKNDANVSFIIYRSYDCMQYHASVLESLQKSLAASSSVDHLSGVFILARDAGPAVPEREHMEINSGHLINTIEAVKAAEPSDQALLSGWDREQNMLAPYLHFYHVRQLLRNPGIPTLSEHQSQHMGLLLDYLDDQFGDEYEEAEMLFVEGYVNRKHLHKLFGPREVLATTKDGYLTAVVARYPPLPGSDSIRLECETWEFDGRFSKHTKNITISWPKSDSGMDKVPIKSLSTFPLRLDQTGLEERLKKRGELFWQLRERRFVNYTAPRESLEFQMQNGRYMVDTNTYRHFSGNPSNPTTTDPVGEYLPPELVQLDSPPPGPFTLLLPPTIYGFGFHDKAWRKLAVEYISEIAWNTGAFDMLVLPAESKDVLAALVAGYIPSTQNIPGQGHGVVILLHGGPGTGKTFTAEALADLGRKPLYRLTSSDIGTDLAKIEKNFDKAFHLGSVWDAVILLEECDVFLEQKQVTDFSRNAVVSVILQALDRYEGIFILTSNRVALLDEALKSRVRVAIEFKLDKEARHELWSNAIRSLHSEHNDADGPIAFDDLNQHIPALAQSELTAFEEFHGSKLPKYAILSHTWGYDEVTIQEWSDPTSVSHKSGFKKIIATCQQAKMNDYSYAWVDTNCIDKSSSAELTEAINSMFAWYTQASVRYAYLSDIPTFKPLSYAEQFRQSRWFKRGWTLQELLAPEQVEFYAADWSLIGTKASLVREIASATGISIKYLCPKERSAGLIQNDWVQSLYTLVHEASVAERMSWLSRRETTRIEDMAYCMLGLFGIHMPLVYGEGPRAFMRLQEEILKSSDDHSLFCWSWATGETQGSLLSPRPHSFLEASRYEREQSKTRPLPYTMTNAGLSIRLPLIHCWSSYIAALNVQIAGDARHVGPWTQSSPLANYTRCQAGALLSFGHRDSFMAIETFPPNRFSESDSVLVICPPQDDDAAGTEWVQKFLQVDAGFAGATLVRFTMPKERIETIVFAVTTTESGSSLSPRWHYCNITRSLLSLGVYGLTMEALGSEKAFEFVKRAIRDPQYAGTVNQSFEDRSMTVDIAKSEFLTTTASVLKHIHIDFKPRATELDIESGRLKYKR